MSTQRVNIDQAKDQISDLIAAASEGGEVIFEQNGKPLARLIPATDAAAYKSGRPTSSEFSSDEDLLAWDATGWENVA
jgi:prevent-host-death family protein